MGHLFRDCRSASINLGDMLDLRRHLHFTAHCHFACGFPRFVCLVWSGSCPYVDILAPTLLLAYREPKHRFLLQEHLQPPKLETEAPYATALCRFGVIYGVKVPLAVVVFDKVMQVRQAEIEVGSH